MPTVTICPSPALYSAYHIPNAIIVVADIFRATSSICTAFANGAKSIITVATLEEALDYKAKGYLVAAERNTRKCDFADFGNSPFDFTPNKVNSKNIVFTTTNGTKAIDTAYDYEELVLGSFLNINAVANYCIKRQKDILILCSGWNNCINLEDSLFAGALANILSKSNYQTHTDSTLLANENWKSLKDNLFDFIKKSEHAKCLHKNNQENDIMYCLQQNIFNFVPQLKTGHFFI